LIPLGIISAAGSSVIPIVSSLSLGISGSYWRETTDNIFTFSDTNSGPFNSFHTDIGGLRNPLTITATLSGYPESGAASSLDLSGKPIAFTYSFNGFSPMPSYLNTDSNGQSTFTINPSSFSGDGDAIIIGFNLYFGGQDSGQIIYPSSISRTANFFTYDAGGGAA
jgi:hypothetical protein